ncbi:MAG: hypothetical protein NTV51_03950, partial [Verrucomicrobia bacterium]|nr:hypothetical protein [Verrucomicrobiota bacterium]
MSAPNPADEARRIAALRRYEGKEPVLDPAFDDFVLLAMQVSGAPAAAVVLVDETCLWIKSSCGPLPDNARRDLSFCTHAV